MKILPREIYPHYESEFFSLDIKNSPISTMIVMQTFSGLYTSHYPNTFKLLRDELPSVLKSECFNKQKKPFFEEVKDTEIAHLFEHILLEYLCIEKLASGGNFADFSGWTEWDWDQEEEGVFHITVNCGLNDIHLLPKAMEKSIALISLILASGEKEASTYGSLVIGSTQKLKT